MEDVFIYAILAVILVEFLLIMLGVTVCRKSIGCSLFGWHDCEIDDPAAKIKTGKCRYCGGKCEMDYEGNWHLTQNSGAA